MIKRDLESMNSEFEELAKNIYNEKDLNFSRALAHKLEEIGLDNNSIKIACFLRADLENEEMMKSLSSVLSSEEIEKIKLLKRLSGVQVPETKKLMEKLRKIFIDLADDLSIIFIKLAERLLSLKEAEANKSEDLIQLAEECLYLYSPIAHRLGIRVLYNEMEDIAFKHLYPKDYKRLDLIIEKQRPVLEAKIEKMEKKLADKLKTHNIVAKINHRVKRLYSIFRKIQNKGVTLQEIFDLMALRVITDSAESCYLALGVVHSSWVPIEGRFRDWVTFPKPNGYRSIQTTVHTRQGDKFEIQVRTEEMHQEAEYGTAAHWAYKEGVIKKSNDENIMRLKEFLENDEYFENPHELLEKINSEMKRDTINVLTPRGDIKTLTAGATPVDFAFSVHTDLGYRITGARINGKFAKLRTELKSGDVIDIISQSNASPSRDWLSFVKSTRARSKILRWFKNNEREQMIQEGKNAFNRLKKRNKRVLEGQDDENELKTNLAKIGISNTDEFYYGIACKNIKLSRNLLRKLYPNAFEKAANKKQGEASKGFKAIAKPQIRVEGLDHIKTQMARCCNPIKGEAIVAYVSRKSGIKIHKKNCTYIKSLDTERFKLAEWLDTASLQGAKLKAYGENFSKMLIRVVEIAADLKISVLSTNRISNFKDDEGIGFELEIQDISQLNKFIATMKQDHCFNLVKLL